MADPISDLINIITSEFFAFLVFSTLTLVLALFTVRFRQTQHSILWLATFLISISVFYIVLAAPFLFAVQLIVYAGGIVVLMIFAIMLTGKESTYPYDAVLDNRIIPTIAAALFGIAAVGTFLWALNQTTLLDITQPAIGTILNSLSNPEFEILSATTRTFLIRYAGTVAILGLLTLAGMLGGVHLVRKELPGLIDEKLKKVKYTEEEF